MRLPHTWCNVHEPKPTSQEEQPDPNADVFEAVAQIEEVRLETYHINLIGITIMNTITNDQLVNQLADAAPRIHTRHQYFDPLDIVEDIIHHPTFKARVLSSMAWLLDNQSIYMARVAQGTLYRDRFEIANEEDRIGSFDEMNFAEFAIELDSVVKRPEWFVLDNETGHDDAHPLATLSQLMALHSQWHDHAATAAAEDNRDYNPRNFEQLILNEKVRTTSIETRKKFEQVLQRKGYDDATRARRLTAMVERDELLAAERLANDRDNMAYTMLILDRAGEHNTSSRFDMLPKRTQRSLCASISKLIERTAQEDLARLRSITVTDYGDILDECDAAVAQFRAVLETQLADTPHMGESQRTIDRARQLKDSAAQSESSDFEASLKS